MAQKDGCQTELIHCILKNWVVQLFKKYYLKVLQLIWTELMINIKNGVVFVSPKTIILI